MLRRLFTFLSIVSLLLRVAPGHEGAKANLRELKAAGISGD